MEYAAFPIDALEEKYQKFTAKVNAFLHSDPVSTKTEMLSFISLCTGYETDLTAIKSSLGLISAQIQRDFNEILRDVHGEYSSNGKRITKHEIDLMKLDAKLIDCQYKLDCLKVYSEGLESYKWLLKFRREQASDYFRHVKGMDF